MQSSEASSLYAIAPRSGAHPPVPAHLALRRVALVLRHGDRTPIASRVGAAISDSQEARRFWASKVPAEERLRSLAAPFSKRGPVHSSDDEAVPYGQLTELGAQQLRRLGRVLRERFVDESALLSATPQPSELWLRATNIRRTQQSLQNLLLGMYPELDDGSVPSGIEIRVYERDHETMIPNPTGKCERHDEIIREIETLHLKPSEFVLQRYLGTPGANEGSHPFDLERFASTIRQLIGIADSDPVNWQVVREVLTCNAVHHGPVYTEAMSMLDETEGISVLEALTDYSAWLWGQLYRNHELSTLALGRLIHEMMMDLFPDAEHPAMQGELAHVQPCPNSAKLLVYSGHDSTLVPLLCTLGIYDDVWPPYGSYLEFEVAEDVRDGGMFVRIVYNDKEFVQQGDTDAWQSWETFYQRMRAFIPTDYESQCKPQHAEESFLSDKCHSLADDVSTTIR